MERLKTSIAFRIFCSLFSPNPGKSRSFSSRASFSMSAIVAVPNFFQSAAIFLGPSDCSVSRSRIVAGYLLSSFLRRRVVAGLENFADVRGHVFADAGEFGELGFVLGELFDAFVKAADQLGGLFVGAIAADDGAVNFEKLGCFPEDSGDFVVLHAGIIREMKRESQCGGVTTEASQRRHLAGDFDFRRRVQRCRRYADLLPMSK